MTVKEIRERLDALIDKKDFTSEDYLEAKWLIEELEKSYESGKWGKRRVDIS